MKFLEFSFIDRATFALSRRMDVLSINSLKIRNLSKCSNTNKY